MKVLLIAANTEQIDMATIPLGLASVAESIKAHGHEVLFLDLMFQADLKTALQETLEKEQPGCIGISVRNIDDQRMESTRFLLTKVKVIIDLCREKTQVPIVLGGAGYTIFPHAVLTFLGADLGIAGEGEGAFPALLEALETGKSLEGVPGLHRADREGESPKSFMKELDNFPLPDLALLLEDVKKNPDPWIPVQTRRGCPLACSYCSTPKIEGTAIRERSPEAVVDWLKQWVEVGYTQFYFVDNTFNLPVPYAKALCREMISQKLGCTWSAIVYPGQMDAELVDLMAESGCVRVSIGFESGSEKMLRVLNKHFTLDDVRAACACFQNKAIQCMGFLLLGGPGETRETVKESLDFADSLNLDSLRVTVGIRIYPDTEVVAAAVERGLVSVEDTLLTPVFYLEPELAQWLPAKVAEWTKTRPYALG
ncbi:MAG: radical SAM protein [Candidatus Hydrogenedens sp.]|jgi:radical SAM superfamily enzyme YgiQ (UPF0313 family)|nr:radical SAM protein [Candidatus Hydrogenedens sp.]